MSLPVPYLSARTLTVVKKIDTSGAARVVNLGLNESWLGAAPGVVEAIREAAPQVYRYADPGCGTMRAAIGKQFNLNPARIVCGNGSEELLDAVGRVYARAGDEILFPAYSFLQFAIVAYRLGAKAVEAPLGPDFSVDVDALLAAVTPATRVIFLANPNNPTGSVVPMDEVARLARELPSHVVLVLDAAYAEYVDPAEAVATFEIADRHPNVIVTRTFSKAYGLASARAGWAYAYPEVVAALNNVRGIGNVNGLAQVAATVAVGEQDFIQHVRARTAEERDYLERELRTLGFEISPSAANFAFVRLPGAAAGWAQATVARLAKQGFIIRSNEDYGLPEWLRISIADRADLDEMLGLLRVEVRAANGERLAAGA
ncbi:MULTISPECIES: pyridoxal phosphate-dependent aminotransferase [Aminobacter]|uniref:pyridoxal phosphate-dependent aminotransferase n=1 Tax=Aminobacter TaxID=31988 RepID=UPI000D50541A|nr:MULTISPECIES: histidinol-phosphate transaminase [Aminobacter]AWC25918.1 Histidinol-phosphate aminotransferase 2 [Aminobacter sp. MSH1]CAI2936743.1 Histidinol-phosphate aminotransferase [Aminobacter niigataensis]